MDRNNFIHDDHGMLKFGGIVIFGMVFIWGFIALTIIIG